MVSRKHSQVMVLHYSLRLYWNTKTGNNFSSIAVPAALAHSLLFFGVLNIIEQYRTLHNIYQCRIRDA